MYCTKIPYGLKFNEKYHNDISKNLKENNNDTNKNDFQWRKVKMLHHENNNYKRTIRRWFI